MAKGTGRRASGGTSKRAARGSKAQAAVKPVGSLRRQGLLCAAASLAIAAAMSAEPAWSTAPGDLSVIQMIPTPAVGGTVVNPLTGANETVVQVLSPISVLTNQNNTILLANAVNDSFTIGSLTYTVTAVHVNGVTGQVDQVTVKDNQSTPVTSTIDRVQNQSGLNIPGQSGGDAGANLTPVAPPGNNNYADNRRGGNGPNGRDGGGVQICPPLVGCFTIGVDPENGGNGSTGPTINTTLTADYSSISDNVSAVSISSIGGDGGTGGDGYLAVDGRPGGAAGAGGPVTVNVSGTLATSGAYAHGLFVQSRAGVGGLGGSGYIFGSGGGGGPAAQGGTVDVDFSGEIGTSGAGSIGILAQSLGGAAGGGGDSYGIIGSAASGSTGGNGGTVTVDSWGEIHTTGNDAHGILAQSIGGSGGNAGNAGGIVAFGDSGGLGGNGGDVTVVAHSGSVTTTTGFAAFGVAAQSVGGGGGSGGFGAGLVGLGSDGGSAGNGGAVNLTLESGAVVATTGFAGVGLFAQSVGGGGGFGGTGAGIVGLGADGASGGTGGTVTVNSSGSIHTTGTAGFGLIAQSLGGGGGAAMGSGGIVALGGSGGGAGDAGAVNVTLGSTSSIITEGMFASGVYAQSVGGGGGLGAAAGGVVSLGGSGGSGGDGGAVTVSNAGLVSTQGAIAYGILAQSLGGGGGTGGASGGLVTIGGTGGGSSVGGNVSLTNTGQVSTHGNLSTAIQAQSIGGGGGDGGTTGGVFLTIGGSGASGGAAGTVTVNHAGFISTDGNDSHGIFAQSLGGGGGNGGSTVSVSAFAGVAIGGAGDLAGNGNTVDINLSQQSVLIAGIPTLVDPQIVTHGDRSRGIFAQSIGGGGGNGGFAAQVAAGYGGAAGAAIGGRGAGGGDGGQVSVDGDVSIFTQGNNSEGLFAESVGGGGGTGGMALQFSFAAGETAAASFSLALGGAGGGGGDGGLVTVDSGGAITTQGDFSTGFVAQSVGGGGGNGGFSIAFAGSAAGTASASAAVGVGGSGGDGGLGGTVNAAFDGTIETFGDDSLGALIQSAGGGGGNGGFNVTGTATFSGTAAVGVSVGVGGTGGGGGNGGTVTGSIGNTVVTHGDRSHAVVVQSVGGGGGNGGFNVSGSIAGSPTVGVGVSVGVGGAGGDGGDGGSVTATARDIETFGEESFGFLAQSVGGAGGTGGFNVSGSIGIGGTAGAGVAIGVGGAGGGGGDGGAVVATVTGDVLTHGDLSDGVIAQSLGGGGGSGGFNVSGSITASQTAAVSVAVGVGGFGGDGGNAGTVNLSVTGSSFTEGDKAGAILAQSVGGGGGSGGFNVSGAISLSETGAGNLGVSVGGLGGGGGDGAAVTLNVNTGVADASDTLRAAQTLGDGSAGIVAQSIGGAGGSGGFSVSGGLAITDSGGGNIGFGIGGGGGGGGDASTVDAFINGDVVTFGDDSAAILVQSVGGGGGRGGFNVTGGIAGGQAIAGNILVGVGGFGGGGGNAGAVTGAVTSDIVTFGDDSFGVAFQSLGGSGGAGGFNVTGGIAVSTVGGGGSGNVGVGVGGFGDSGGDGSTVNASFAGDIITFGKNADGAIFQSAGGGGGVGAFNVTGGLSIANSMTGSIGVGVGGFGGDGGDGAAVVGSLVGDVTTLGDDSYGVLLQSAGGSGGRGGLNVTGNIALNVTSGASVAVGVGIGGFGGDGGNASTVEGTVTGAVTTLGAHSSGVVAESVGGGGGAGGINVTGNIAIGLGGTGTGGFGLGGFGGGAGDASDVTLVRLGDTVTQGIDSSGVVAQSVGGKGGQGGLNVTGGLSFTTTGTAGSVGVGIGGFGGGGGDAGDVELTVTGNTWAQGSSGFTLKTDDLGDDDDKNDIKYQSWENGSHGVMAQSVGGGGGAGGINITGDVSITIPGATSASRAGSFGLGGFGGAGGDAGTVDLTVGSANSSRVQAQAQGDDRYAVAAQSIGGGGGAGGLNVAGAVAADGSLSIGIGGFGGGGGRGDDVDASVNADLFAEGHRARGLLVQSVGGGGGAGGININGSVTYDPTTKEPAVALGLGGFGGAGNSAGDVTSYHNGLIRVHGYETVGALVQSVGGGGGSGGINVSGSGTGGVQPPGTRTAGYALAIGVGGTGGAGADGATVDFRSVGNIFMNVNATPNGAGGFSWTPMDYANGGVGILVQSVGGGGGVGGFNAAAAIAPSGSPLVVGVGGTGGPGGSAGAVTLVRGYDVAGGGEVEAAGVIITAGKDSTGIHAQSVGGGGGKAGINLTVPVRWAESTTAPFAAVINVGGSAGDGGDASTVNVRHLGDIYTSGQRSHGLFAQSIGGGGGDLALNVGLGRIKDAAAIRMTVGGETGDGGKGDDVTVVHDGEIWTAGVGSDGIRAESIGGGGGDAMLDVIVAISAAHTIDIGIGSDGGTAATSGDVSVTAHGRIVTAAMRSNGIYAQSVGGGGGSSSADSFGLSATANAGTPQAESASVSFSLGRQGATGAKSGDVTVVSDADIVTLSRDSVGIYAQAIGGGGGAGGSAGSAFVLDSLALGLAIGGLGGTGAESGVVTVDNDGQIQTYGDASHGILAQSIGGGGGNGGHARTIELNGIGKIQPPGQVANSFGVAIGGTGGTGALGGHVDVTNTGLIVTRGVQAHGVWAQSIGGGGGNGGATISLLIQGNRTSNTGTFHVGGQGGVGAKGGAVDVLNEGRIVTVGQNSHGIQANSIGGGGGDAGLMLDLAVGAASGTPMSNSHRVTFNIGGSGGTGGEGGTVHVINRPVVGDDDSGEIVTLGRDAYGIFAQSLGGGGGNGSSILSLTVLGGTKDSGTFGLNIGGTGGDGNKGGTVIVDNLGSIDTYGAGSHGIVAQSVGGGGGDGGIVLAGSLMIMAPTASPLIAIGGTGGDGSTGGTVTVNNSGSIVTRGENAHGILAQSIGGGGGNANVGFSLSGNPYTFVISNALAGVVGGLGGGTGGQGGQVTVNQTGDITVLGAGSTAIKAESLNGGGGDLAISFEGVIGLPGIPIPGLPPKPKVSVSAGGHDVSGSNPNLVTVNTSGNFAAAGKNGAGALSQSISGGGGNLSVTASLSGQNDDPTNMGTQKLAIEFESFLGGDGGTNNNGGAATAVHTGTILTTGKNTPGVLMQSIGGGGGRSVIDLTVPADALLGQITLGLGSAGETNAAGGAVSRTQTGAIVTTGDMATGVVLQSIGGGGGSSTVSLTGAGSTGAVVALTMGADGGSGLGGGAVSGTFSGGIETLGNHAIGLFAQSIGAGGGEVRLSGVGGLSAALGGLNGAQGSGGTVNLTNTGDIFTHGAGSHAVFLQSVGGGGGAVFGAPAATSVVLNSGGVGNGGAISFLQTGAITVSGVDAYGVAAQSIGGGGGWIDGAFRGTAGGTGVGGSINLTLAGQVFAAEAGSTAIFAQSRGASGGGNVTITGTGLIRGGSGTGAGVRIDGGANNTITSSGSISAVSGLAIDTGAGNDEVNNDGLVIGNIDLGAGQNAFNNRAGSTFIAFSTIDLYDGALPVPKLFETVSRPTEAQDGGQDPKAFANVSRPSEDGGEDAQPSGAKAFGNISRPSEQASGDGVPDKFGNIRRPSEEAAAGESSGKFGDISRPVEDVRSLASGKDFGNISRPDGGGAVALVGPQATFTNSGDFLMGLSASRYPIDLLNGDVFGNLDHIGTPQTNLLYGARVINTVALDGHFVQTQNGFLAFDVAFGPYASDRVNVTGNATVDGTGEVILTWLENRNKVTLFATGGDGFDNGLEIEDTLAIDYSIQADTAGVHLNIETDFGQPFLNRNERALGRHMDSAMTVGGSSGIGRLGALLGNMRVGEELTYAAVMNQLNPEPHTAPLFFQLDQAQGFGGQLFGCAAASATTLDDQCVWSRLEFAGSDQNASFENFGVEGASSGLRMGFQRPTEGDWSVAVAIGYERLRDLSVDNGRARSNGQAMSAGFGMQRRSADGLSLGWSLSGGWSWLETDRVVTVFTTGVGHTEVSTGFAQARFDAAQLMRAGNLFAKPALGISATALHHDGLREDGLAGLGVWADGDTQFIAAIEPDLTLGAVLMDSPAHQAVWSVTVGGRLNSTDELTLPVSFIGSGPGAQPAVMSTPLDQALWRVSTDLTLTGVGGLSVNFGYTGEWGDAGERHRAGLNLKYRF
jgi:hypothetical protein